MCKESQEIWLHRLKTHDYDELVVIEIKPRTFYLELAIDGEHGVEYSPLYTTRGQVKYFSSLDTTHGFLSRNDIDGYTVHIAHMSGL